MRGTIAGTGASRASILSLKLYMAYCQELGVIANLKQFHKYTGGIGGQQSSIGSTIIIISFPELAEFVDVEFPISDEDVTTLWSCRDIKRK